MTLWPAVSTNAFTHTPYYPVPYYGDHKFSAPNYIRVQDTHYYTRRILYFPVTERDAGMVEGDSW